MRAETTHVPPRRLLLACLAVLHVLAAPCAMALATATDAPCDHCAAGDDYACTAGQSAAAGDDGLAAPARTRPPAGPEAAVPAGAALVRTGGLKLRLAGASPTARVALATGRHSGDPPLRILLGRFLI